MKKTDSKTDKDCPECKGVGVIKITKRGGVPCPRGCEIGKDVKKSDL